MGHNFTALRDKHRRKAWSPSQSPSLQPREVTPISAREPGAASHFCMYRVKQCVQPISCHSTSCTVTRLLRGAPVSLRTALCGASSHPCCSGGSSGDLTGTVGKPGQGSGTRLGARAVSKPASPPREHPEGAGLPRAAQGPGAGLGPLSQGVPGSSLDPLPLQISRRIAHIVPAHLPAW